jgi:LL-diaminopimelate aminotransferase
MDSGQFKPMQMASIRALRLSNDWYAQQNAIYYRRRVIAGRILELLGCTYENDQCGLFLWARIPDQFPDGYSFSQWLLTEAHLFITPGGVFGDQGNRFVRISLCSSQELLGEAIRRLETNQPALRGEKANPDSTPQNAPK